jgi:hypothetical protein
MSLIESPMEIPSLIKSDRIPSIPKFLNPSIPEFFYWVGSFMSIKKYPYGTTSNRFE